MITEDYVSFEVAKLLKEKGFDENTPVNYFKHRGCVVGEMIHHKRLEEDTHLIACPTLQMAMKWLREEKEIFISICGCTYPQERKVTWIPDISTFDSVSPDSAIEYDAYEEACEAAIKYCLENLI